MTPSTKLRGGVVGYGFIAGSGHIPAYAERTRTRCDVEIVAVADVSARRREKARQEVPGARIYESAEALLCAEGSGLDFVDIATPPVDHARIAKAALERGLHVLCEKPLAMNTDEARSLLQTA